MLVQNARIFVFLFVGGIQTKTQKYKDPEKNPCDKA